MSETHSWDMTEHWRLVSVDVEDDTHRIHGTWWVARTASDADFHVKPVDMSIWHKAGRWGRVFYSDSLTAFVRDGVVDLPKHMVYRHLADAEDAWDLLLVAVKAAADTPWKPLAEETPS